MPSSFSSSSSVLTIPNLRLRALRIWSSKDYAIAAFVFLLLFSLILFSHLDSRSRSRYPSHPSSTLVPLTLLRNANRTRAFCLDGSAPGYHFRSGFGSGSRNWLLHIEVKIRYCDGASFAGHPESEQRGSGLFFRGQVIWEAIMDELLSIGLSKTKQALLSGCSAGGLATLIHCDNFRKVLPKEATVKCLADAGFFLDEKDISGNSTMRSFYHDVTQLQGVAKSLHKDCIAKMEPSKAAYDFWQDQIPLVTGKTAG
ncbi:unnamed protein product [Sphenostylis stenocarpa]|uniref:Pectin acetylesterase n=1 Tax=Sphenostylis stenocarpa TaxID=92480 RepID=A0AA86V8K3_9FABA|nr:unnamed protein product [Sphenostylis stenocarpa]